MQFRNWAGNVSCGPTAIHRPHSEEAVADLVGSIAGRGERLRVVGAGHSWSDIVRTDGHHIQLDHLDAVHHVDAQNRRVTVGAGLRLHALVAALRAQGLGLINRGSIDEQSVAGAVATGTHGTGLRLGSLCTQVAALRLVTATGQTLDVDVRSDPDLFAAARLHLGALGVVTQLTLDVRDDYRLVETTQSVDLDGVAGALSDHLTQHRHTKLWWLPHTEQVAMFFSDETQEPVTPRTRQQRMDSFVARSGAFNGLLAVGRCWSGAIPTLNRAVGPTLGRNARRVAPYDEILGIDMPPKHLELEYAVPSTAAATVLNAIRKQIQTSRLCVNFVVEFRWVARDDILLSPTFERDGCHVTACVAPSRDAERYFREVEAVLRDHDGRPHWGKLFTPDKEMLQRAFPGLGRFEAVRKQLDPNGVFSNPFIRRVLSNETT